MSEHDNLPSGWTIAPLRYVATINPANPANVPSDGTPVSFVPMAAVEELSGRMDPSRPRRWSDVKKGFTRFQEGDVVFAKITPCMENGKVALATNLIHGVAAGTTELHVFRPQTGVTGRYLLHYLLQETFRRRARARMTGTAGQLRVPTQFLEEEVFPLAPTLEQQRIVEAVDSYLTRLDDAVASLEQAQAKLKAYRASVLKAAVEGRLVPTEASLARAEKRDYEPADVLLERIVKERRRRWEQAELAKLKAAGKVPKDDKWKGKYEDPIAPDTSDRPQLPEGWCWTTAGRLCDCIVPNRDKPKTFSGDTPWITLPDLGEAVEVRRSNSGAGLTDEEIAKYGAKVIPEDSVIMSCIGRFGVTAVLRRPAVVNQQLHAFLPSPGLLPTFLAYAIRSQIEYMNDLATSTTIAYLNKTNCNSVPIPLPPTAEQARIVSELERLDSIVSECTRLVKLQARRAARLRQAILKWAFEGKLVDQDPTDEPAETLLARVRGERDATGSVKNRTPKRAA